MENTGQAACYLIVCLAAVPGVFFIISFHVADSQYNLFRRDAWYRKGQQDYDAEPDNNNSNFSPGASPWKMHGPESITYETGFLIRNRSDGTNRAWDRLFLAQFGMGVMITYGSIYRSKTIFHPKRPVSWSSILWLLCWPDSCFSGDICAGNASRSGTGLLFSTAPILFNYIPGGYWFRILFFLFNGLSRPDIDDFTAGSDNRPIFVDEFNLSRKKMAIIGGTITYCWGFRAHYHSDAGRKF
jgi:hypothetical protein